MRDVAAITRPIRVALAGFGGLGAASVRGCLVGQADIAIVRELRDADARGAALGPHECDVLVTARTTRGVPGALREQLFADAGVPVIAIAEDGRLEIYDKRVLREATLAELLAEVRRVVSQAAAP